MTTENNNTQLGVLVQWHKDHPEYFKVFFEKELKSDCSMNGNRKAARILSAFFGPMFGVHITPTTWSNFRSNIGLVSKNSIRVSKYDAPKAVERVEVPVTPQIVCPHCQTKISYSLTIHNPTPKLEDSEVRLTEKTPRVERLYKKKVFVQSPEALQRMRERQALRKDLWLWIRMAATVLNIDRKDIIKQMLAAVGLQFPVRNGKEVINIEHATTRQFAEMLRWIRDLAKPKETIV